MWLVVSLNKPAKPSQGTFSQGLSQGLTKNPAPGKGRLRDHPVGDQVIFSKPVLHWELLSGTRSDICPTRDITANLPLLLRFPMAAGTRVWEYGVDHLEEWKRLRREN